MLDIPTETTPKQALGQHQNRTKQNKTEQNRNSQSEGRGTVPLDGDLAGWWAAAWLLLRSLVRAKDQSHHSHAPSYLLSKCGECSKNPCVKEDDRMSRRKKKRPVWRESYERRDV
jgi:hypothetical protein